MAAMKYLLRDRNIAMVEAWRQEFAQAPDVEVSHGDIFDVVADAIVSPANSFGFMDGGIDLVYTRHFGWGLQERLRERLRAEFDGELPVGQAIIVETDDPSMPFLISAPTMRVPMDVSDTVNAYLAFRAAIRAVRAHNGSQVRQIASVLCPGLGTAVGRMSAEVCARQMHYAYGTSHLGQVWNPLSLGQVVDIHLRMVR
jgi:O-acetyl-ADP-ribose deacetylase (regulator of RNase III)